MIVKRTIKNNVQEYEYRGKQKKYDAYVQFKMEQDKKEKLVQRSEQLGFGHYSKLIRHLIDKELENM